MKKIIKSINHAVGYCRYSSDNQSEASIEAQKFAIQKYANEQNLIMLDWYIDRAQSGTTDNRVDFKRMLADSKGRNFSKVLVYQLDRFARNKEDHVMHKVDLRKNGVKVISVTEKFDDTPEGKMMESMVEMMSAYYSQDLSRKTIRGLTLNATKALNNGGAVPYGFKLIPRLDENKNIMHHSKGHELHDLAIHPERAEAVKIIYKMTLEGKKRFEIIDRLNELGYTRTVFIGKGKNRPRVEKNFTEAGTLIDNILRNEKYTGTYVYDSNKKHRKEDLNCAKEIIRVYDKLPLIISRETFDAVQQILKQRVKTPSVCTEEYLLSGKLICGECETPYSGARQIKGGKIYPYYKCNRQVTYKNGSKLAEYCHNNTVQRDKIERFVTKQVAKILSDERNIDKVLDEYNRFAAEMNDNSELIDMYEKQIKDIDKQVQNIIDIIAKTGNFSELLNTKLDSLNSEKKKVSIIIEQEKKAIGYLPATKEELRQVFIKAREQLEFGTFEERKSVLYLFLNKVIIYKEFVEIFVNLIPISHLGGIDVNIIPQAFIGELEKNTTETAENTTNSVENTESTLEDMEKDGQCPSSSTSLLYSDTFFGSPGRI